VTKPILWADLETFSPLNLKKVGTHAYAEKSEILLFPFAFGEGDPTAGTLRMVVKCRVNFTTRY